MHSATTVEVRRISIFGQEARYPVRPAMLYSGRGGGVEGEGEGKGERSVPTPSASIPPPPHARPRGAVRQLLIGLLWDWASSCPCVVVVLLSASKSCRPPWGLICMKLRTRAPTEPLTTDRDTQTSLQPGESCKYPPPPLLQSEQCQVVLVGVSASQDRTFIQPAFV